jgi:uncharacterized protein (DUF302 family)
MEASMIRHHHLSRIAATLAIFALATAPEPVGAADAGLITKASNHSVQETTERFESAVKSKGWIIFTQIDHAGAAKQAGLDMKPRTVILFGNPKIGTAPMQKAATLAIDNPPKALVWEDDNGKVWLSYNSGEYLRAQVYPRHGLTMPPEAVRAIEQLLTDVSDQATK